MTAAGLRVEVVVTRAAEVATVEGNEESRVGSSVRVKVAVTVEPKGVVVTAAGLREVELRVAVVTAAGLRVEVVTAAGLRVEVVVTRAAEVATVEGNEESGGKLGEGEGGGDGGTEGSGGDGGGLEEVEAARVMVVTRVAEVASVEDDEGSRVGSSVTVKVVVTVEPKGVVVTAAGLREVELRVAVVTAAGLKVEVVTAAGLRWRWW